MEITVNDNGVIIIVKIPEDKEIHFRRAIIDGMRILQENSEGVRRAREILAHRHPTPGSAEPKTSLET